MDEEPIMAVEGYEAQIKALLENKDSLTKKMTKDGRSEYAVQMNKLKKRMKADGASFNKALNSVKKQEREGTFDRGAEGKRKKKLRAKLHKEHNLTTHGAQHKGTRADKITEKYKDIDPGQKKHIKEVQDNLGIKKVKIQKPNLKSR